MHLFSLKKWPELVELIYKKGNNLRSFLDSGSSNSKKRTRSKVDKEINFKRKRNRTCFSFNSSKI